MWTSVHKRLFGFLVGTALAACGSDLTLPDDGAPARLEAVSGGGQEGTVGRRLHRPLVVELTDASAHPVVGTVVAFGFQGSVPDAEIDPTATTDASGRASAEVRLGTSTGSLTVEARVLQPSASHLRATFDLTARARERGERGGDDEDD
jgi:hypothetical protein